MHRSNTRSALVFALAVIAIAACSSSSKTASPATTTSTTAAAPTSEIPSKTTVAIAPTKLGKVLVDSRGMTLYLYDKDTTPGTSACTGACAQVWPPLIVTGTPIYGPGVTASMFGTLTRADGSRQLAVNGKPLYGFSGDTAPGDTAGQGEGDFSVAGVNGKNLGG